MYVRARETLENEENYRKMKKNLFFFEKKCRKACNLK